MNDFSLVIRALSDFIVKSNPFQLYYVYSPLVSTQFQLWHRYCPVIDCHTSHVACSFEHIIDKIDRRTGEVLEEEPEFVVAGECCTVDCVPQRPFCVETYDEFPPLGRFAVRDLRQTVAVGIIKEVTPAEPDDDDDDDDSDDDDSY